MEPQGKAVPVKTQGQAGDCKGKAVRADDDTCALTGGEVEQADDRRVHGGCDIRRSDQLEMPGAHARDMRWLLQGDYERPWYQLHLLRMENDARASLCDLLRRRRRQEDSERQ